MNNWLNLTKEEQIELFNQAAAITGLPPFAIEKDAWVTLVLRMLFSSKINSHIVFKGGTSLSKVYGLIERFSEDVDFAMDRCSLGFSSDLTKGKIRKLRKASHDFSYNELPGILKSELTVYGIEEDLFEIEVPNTEISDQDPEIIHVNYKSVFEEESYLQSRVLIEIGARSLMEPFENKEIKSIIDTCFPDSDFTEENFSVKTVIPEKTFLEKLILLHEEFQKETEKIRYERMSRHLYDIFQIMKTEYGKGALKNDELFQSICNHRKVFTPVRTVNYSELKIESLSFLPPNNFMELYRSDYNKMRSNMIYGDSPDFDELIEQLKII